MLNLIQQHWFGNRSAVSPDTDRLADDLVERLDARIVEAGSGEAVLTWRVPKRWNVRRGQLLSYDGTILADFADNPLHLWTHSVSFSGVVPRDELLEHHVYSDPNRPYEIPYHYRNGFRYDAQQWGFSLPHILVDQLNDERYRVIIDADLDTQGSIKVVDAYLPGARAETIFVMAHTCHPAMVSDGIANIAVAIELYHHLRSQPKRRYSYRFIFGPEYFAAATYLARAEPEVVANLCFGIYLDLLSCHEPIGLQRSLQGNTGIDQMVKNVLESHTEVHSDRPFRRLIANDENFYNGPGFEIPTVGLARSLSREYHYHSDNVDNMNVYHMEEAAWLLIRVSEVLETDFVPIRKYNGPLYLSQYGLYIDPVQQPQAAAQIDTLQVYMDGTHSCMDLAAMLDLDFFFVRDFCLKLVEHDLLERAQVARCDNVVDSNERPLRECRAA